MVFDHGMFWWILLDQFEWPVYYAAGTGGQYLFILPMQKLSRSWGRAAPCGFSGNYGETEIQRTPTPRANPE